MEARHSLNPTEQQMFSDIAAVMANYGDCVGKFGLFRVHSHFPVNDGEVLHETSDREARVSTVRPIPATERPETSVPSQWVFSGGKPEVSLWCCRD